MTVTPFQRGQQYWPVGSHLSHEISLRTDVKRSFRENVQNLLSWALTSPDRSTDELMHQIGGMFV